MQKIGVQAIFDITPFTKNAGLYTRQIGTLNEVTQNFGNRMSVLGATISFTIGHIVASLTTRAIISGFRFLGRQIEETIAVGADFEQQVAVLKSVVDDQSISLQQLGDAAIAVGNDQTVLGASAVGAAEAMTLLYKGGLDTTAIFGDLQGYLAGTTKLTGALRASFDLAAATELDVGQAADVAVVALSTFGKELETGAQKADFAEYALDFLVRTANASVSEVEDLSNALSYVGPAAQTAGWSLEDVGVAMGLMSNAGMRGTTIGTVLNAMFTDLTETTAKSRAAMDDMGISLYDQAGNMRPIIDIVGQFSVALDGLTDQQRIDKLGAVFDIRGARAMNVLLQNGITGWNDMADAIDNATTMQEQAVTRLDTLKGRWEIFQSTIETLRIQITKGLLNALTRLLEMANKIVKAWGPNIIQAFKKAGNALDRFLIIAGNAPEILQSIPAALEDIKKGDFAGAIQELFRALSPIVGNNVAFTALEKLGPTLRAVTDHSDELSDSLGKIAGGDILGGIGQLGSLIAGMFPTAFGGVLANVSSTISGIATGFAAGDWVGVGQTIGDLIVRGLDKLGELLAPVVARIGEKFASVDWGAVGKTILGLIIVGMSAGIEVLKTTFRRDAEAIKSVDWGAVGTSIMETISTAMSNFDMGATVAAIGNAIGTAFGGGAEAKFDNIVAAITNFATEVIKVKDKVVAFATGVIAKFNEIKTKVQPVIDVVVGYVVAFATAIADVVGPQVAPAFETLRQTFASLIPIWGQLISGIGPLITSVVELVKTFLGFQVVQNMLTGAALAIGTFVAIVISLVVGLITGVATGISAFIDLWSKVAVSVGNALVAAQQMITNFFGIVNAIFTGDFPAALDLLKENFGLLGTFITNVVNAIAGIIVTGFGTISGFVWGFVQGIIAFFTNLYEQLVGGSIIPDMVNGIITWFTSLISDGVALISQFVSSIVEFFATLLTDVVSKITDLVSRVTSGFTDMVSEGMALVTQFVTDVVAKAEELPAKIKGVLADVVAGIKSFVGKFKSVGANLIEGLKNGIKEKATSIVTAAKGVVSSAIQAARNLLGEHSPSTVFADIGENLSKGFAIGIDKMANKPIAAVGGMVTGAVNAVQPATASRTVNNYYTTNLEMNPTYRNYESEASVYFDTVAALAAVGN